MADDINDALQNSKMPRQVRDAACALARSSLAADQGKLLALLKSPAFLARIDTDEALRGSAWSLNLRRVMDDLAGNAAGRPSLVALAGDAGFISANARAELLILACAQVRPAPPAVVKFWASRWQPQDGFTNLTVDAVTLNGSEPAIELLAGKLADNRFSEDERKGWMQASILIHRNDLPLLKMCEMFVKGNASPALKLALVEVLFDYQPDLWFMPATVRQPPPRPPLAKDAAVVLVAIGRHALDQLKPPPELEVKIRATIKVVEPKA